MQKTNIFLWYIWCIDTFVIRWITGKDKHLLEGDGERSSNAENKIMSIFTDIYYNTIFVFHRVAKESHPLTQTQWRYTAFKENVLHLILSLDHCAYQHIYTIDHYMFQEENLIF